MNILISSFILSLTALDNRFVDFIPHTVPKPYESYVSYEIQYAPVKALLEDVKKITGPLTDRGEAHITVITPPEFDNVLSKVLTIDEINDVVLAENIQSATYEPVCVGTGSAGNRVAYYVVVKSPDLIRIRKAVADLYVSRGGDASAFDPKWFFPHITLGYINGDVHESDGLYKTEKTCNEDSRIITR